MVDPDSRSADDGNESARTSTDGSAAAGSAEAADSSDNATGPAPATGQAPGDAADADDLSTEELRERVEERYDFENFGPADMAEMSAEEWEAAFDPDTWITGEALLDRVESDLSQRVADRDVFARVERFDDVLVAYDEQDYAAVYPDGTVEGRGTVRRDVEPTVALCSMESYDVPEPPAGQVLPEPREIPESSDTLGNTLLQVVGGVQVLAGLVLLGAAVFSMFLTLPGVATGGQGANLVFLGVAGLLFLLIGIFMFTVVANARLSDRFRSEAYRERLRGVGLADGERPAFLAEIDGVQLSGRDAAPTSPDRRTADESPATDGDP